MKGRYTKMWAMLLSPMAGRIGSALCVILAILSMQQCSARLRAERGLAKAEKALAVERENLRICRGNVATLEVSLKAQNEAVEALKREADAKVAESRKAVSEARKTAEAYRKRATIILTEKPRSEDMCVEADRVILGSIAQ